MANESNQPDLDLINMVQNARMMHDKTAKPSDYSAVYWIEAKRAQGDYPDPTPNTGEWRVKLHVDDMDQIWERIKAATVAGELGYKSKVSTRPAAGQTHVDDRLLCVRTYNADDDTDVERVKRVLTEMGLGEGLVYVRDKSTD